MNKTQALKELLTALGRFESEAGNISQIVWGVNPQAEFPGYIETLAAYKAFKAASEPAPKTSKPTTIQANVQPNVKPGVTVAIAMAAKTEATKNLHNAINNLIVEGIKDFETDYAPLAAPITVLVTSLGKSVKTDSTAEYDYAEGILDIRLTLNAPIGLPGCRYQQAAVLVYQQLVAFNNQGGAEMFLDPAKIAAAQVEADAIRDLLTENTHAQPDGDGVEVPAVVVDEPARLIVNVKTATVSEPSVATDGAEVVKQSLKYRVFIAQDGEEIENPILKVQEYNGIVELRAGLIEFRAQSEIKWKAVNAVRDLRAGMFPETFTVYEHEEGDSFYQIKVQGYLA